MRLNEILSEKLFTALESAKATSRVSYTQNDVDNICHTINAINGVPYGCSLVGEYFLSDYNIPELFKDFIVPLRIRVTDEEAAINFKCDSYSTDPSVNQSRLLGPEQFMDTWMSVLGPCRMKNLATTQVKPLRVDSKINDADMMKKMYAGKTCKFSDPYFFPINVTCDFFKDFTYSMDPDYVVVQWFTKIVNDNKIGTAKS